MSLHIIEDLTNAIMSRNTGTIQRALDLVDEPNLIVGIAMSVGFRTMRQCVDAIADHVPSLERHPDAVRVAIVGTMFARLISADDYNRLAHMSDKEFGQIMNEIFDTIKNMEQVKG